MTRRLLLVCGILSPFLYLLADAIAGSLTPGYSFTHQTISELGAIGAPRAQLFSALLLPVYILLVAFSVGIWKASTDDRALKVVSFLIFLFGFIAVTVGPFVAMRERGAEQGLAGTLHLVEGAVEMALLIAAMGFAAYALGRKFAVYTIATLAVMFAFGFWSVADVPVIEAGLPTPWVGLKERTYWYAYQLWFAALAGVLLKGSSGDNVSE